MKKLHPQFVKDNTGKNLVVLLQKEYNYILEALEELEDIKRYDAAKKRKQVFVNAVDAFKELDKKRKKHVSIKN